MVATANVSPIKPAPMLSVVIVAVSCKDIFGPKSGWLHKQINELKTVLQVSVGGSDIKNPRVELSSLQLHRPVVGFVLAWKDRNEMPVDAIDDILSASPIRGLMARVTETHDEMCEPRPCVEIV